MNRLAALALLAPAVSTAASLSASMRSRTGARVRRGSAARRRRVRDVAVPDDRDRNGVDRLGDPVDHRLRGVAEPVPICVVRRL